MQAQRYGSEVFEVVGGGRAYDEANPYSVEGPNDSVTGILRDPIVQRGLAFIGAFALAVWLGGRMGR
jgi:hypothetical protein